VSRCERSPLPLGMGSSERFSDRIETGIGVVTHLQASNHGDALIKTYKYRLVPTRSQRMALQTTLDSCRFLYNCALEQRKMHRTGYYEQKRQVTDVRAEFPEYRGIHVHVLQRVVAKLDLAFQSFFRRVKAGQKPGFPRFKGRDRFDSFAFNNTGFKLAGRYLQISKIGAVKLRLSRPIPEGAKIKSLVVKRSGQNWYACLAVEYSPVALPANASAIGLDMGIENFAALSDGTFIPNPRIYEAAQAELRRAQRRVARRKKGSNRRRRAVELLRKVHERIANRRLDFLHKESTKLIQKYGTIVVENLNIKGMAAGMLAKQVQDASWARFIQLLSYKAADAGRRLVEVDCAYTSQTCPECGVIKKKMLSEREHRCECGYTAHRDTAAARIILGRIDPLGVNVEEPISCVA
jgi:putative transposase